MPALTQRIVRASVAFHAFCRPLKRSANTRSSQGFTLAAPRVRRAAESLSQPSEHRRRSLPISQSGSESNPK